MSRFFVEKDNITDKYVYITGSDVNHIKNVLRYSLGDKLSVSDSSGYSYDCVIEAFESDSIRLMIEDKQQDNIELKTQISLFQGLPKKDKLELIIQKAVELGVHDVRPCINERTIVKLDEKKTGSRFERFNKISEAAAKQSGRMYVPEVYEPVSFSEAIKYASENYDVVMLPYENADGMKYAGEVINEAAHAKKVAIFIGPEGGFSAKEVELAKSLGVKIISLGRRILRTETAGLTTISILMFEIEKNEEI